MDDREVVKNKSIQSHLLRWLCLVTLILMTISSMIIGIITFEEAKEHQDELLLEIAKLTSSQVSRISEDILQHQAEHHDETVIIQFVNPLANKEILKFEEVPRGGYSTLKDRVEHKEWRVLRTKAKLGQDFLVAQSTENRNEMALNSCLSLIFPSVFLLLIMLFAIYFILRKFFKPLTDLASKVDETNPMELTSIPEDNIFKEVLPFVKSINRFLLRTNEFSRRQQRFISDAAHELRTPIAGLTLVAEGLESSKSSDDRIKKEKLLSQGLERLGKLVSQLLDLARIQADNTVVYEVTCFEDTIRSVVSDLFTIAQEKGITFNVTLETSAQVYDFKGSLRRLVVNALENAIRYSYDNSQIELSLTEENHHVIFTIHNKAKYADGVEDSQIWEPFYRVEENKVEGTGLGLAICSEIANKLDGKVSLRKLEDNEVEFKYIQRLI